MSEHLRGFTDVQWPIAGFVIFFTLFLVFLALTMLPSQKKKHERLSQLPFDDSSKEVSR